jgi:hypothetical protein
MFDYATTRFQLLPGGVVRCGLKPKWSDAWCGDCSEACGVGSVELNAIREKIVSHAFGGRLTKWQGTWPPEDAGVALHFSTGADTHGEPCVRVWSDMANDRGHREHYCAIEFFAHEALTSAECDRLREIAGELAEHAGCGCDE